MPGGVHESPWDLNRKGSMDQNRHMRRLKEAIMAQLPTIVANTPIIAEPGTKRVRFPVKVLELPRFRHRPPQSPAGAEGVGQGPVKPGDVLASTPRNPSGVGADASDQPGSHTVDIEMDLDTLQGLIFEDLALPPPEPKTGEEFNADHQVWTSRRRHGPYATLDVKASLKAALARSAAEGASGIGALSPDDLRFRAWTVVPEPVTDAVVFLLRDASGSMDEEKRYLSRSLAFWLVRWLRAQYREVRLEFWLHDSEAQSVDEAQFFSMTSSGGTRAASAYAAMRARIEALYPSTRWNIYGFHFTDGEDWAPDLAAQELEQMMTLLRLFAVIELNPRSRDRDLSEALSHLPEPPVVSVVIEGRDRLLEGLHQILGRNRRDSHA